jgi:aromatic-L-amino-acid decarboxylase
VDRPLTAYASSQAHSSVEKAIAIAGVGRDNLRLIDVDDTYAMRPDALARAIEDDRAAGRVPFIVFGTTGTTSSTAMDPLREIGEICRREKVWFHVDAALAGTAALCPEHRWIHDGVDLADSYCFNPHKWMLTNFDCDCFYVTDRAALIKTLSVLPEYLKNKATETGAVFDYRDWHIPLGRRFRALKLWFVIRHYGVEGLRHHIREHVRLAQEFKTWVEADPDFEIAAPVPLNLVCFRHVGGDETNQRLMDRLNASGKIYLTHTKLGDNVTLRFAIGGVDTREQHVRRAWDLIRQTSRDL